MQQSHQRKRRVVHSTYVDIDGVMEAPGPNYRNWTEITKRKLQERESKLLIVIKDEIESIVNETLTTSYAQPQSFVISNGIMNETLLILTNNINEWTGVNLARLKKAPALYRDYYTVSKKSWDRRKTKLFGSALWVNVFKQIHQFVWMNMHTLIRILEALFLATIKYTNTKAQSLITGTMMRESREFQEYFKSLHSSFRIDEWIASLDSKRAAKSLQQKMQSHLNLMLDESLSVVRSNGGDGPIGAQPTEQQLSSGRHYYGHTNTRSIDTIPPALQTHTSTTAHFQTQQALPPQLQQLQPHNFVLNASVVNGGMDRIAVQQMDVDENINGRYYKPQPQQPQQSHPPPQRQRQTMMNSRNGLQLSDTMMMQQNNTYPSGDYNQTTSNNSGHSRPQTYCCCCNCNHNIERSMNSNVMNNNNNNADQLLSGYSSNANTSTETSNPTPPLNVYNNNNSNDMFYDDNTLNEMNNYGFLPLTAPPASTPLPAWF